MAIGKWMGTTSEFLEEAEGGTTDTGVVMILKDLCIATALQEGEAQQ